MAQRKHKTEWFEGHDTAPVTGAIDAARPVVSPARMLQQLIEERGGELAAPQVDRWSQRRTLMFVVTSATALWMAILVAGAEAAKALA